MSQRVPRGRRGAGGQGLTYGTLSRSSRDESGEEALRARTLSMCARATDARAGQGQYGLQLAAPESRQRTKGNAEAHEAREDEGTRANRASPHPLPITGRPDAPRREAGPDHETFGRDSPASTRLHISQEFPGPRTCSS